MVNLEEMKDEKERGGKEGRKNEWMDGWIDEGGG